MHQPRSNLQIKAVQLKQWPTRLLSQSTSRRTCSYKDNQRIVTQGSALAETWTVYRF